MSTQPKPVGATINLTSVIQWVPADLELPDEDITVLVARADGEVHLSYVDRGLWRDDGGSPLDRHITHWANLPEPPSSPSLPSQPSRETLSPTTTQP